MEHIATISTVQSCNNTRVRSSEAELPSRGRPSRFRFEKRCSSLLKIGTRQFSRFGKQISKTFFCSSLRIRNSSQRVELECLDRHLDFLLPRRPRFLFRILLLALTARLSEKSLERTLQLPRSGLVQGCPKSHACRGTQS